MLLVDVSKMCVAVHIGVWGEVGGITLGGHFAAAPGIVNREEQYYNPDLRSGGVADRSRTTVGDGVECGARVGDTSSVPDLHRVGRAVPGVVAGSLKVGNTIGPSRCRIPHRRTPKLRTLALPVIRRSRSNVPGTRRTRT